MHVSALLGLMDALIQMTLFYPELFAKYEYAQSRHKIRNDLFEKKNKKNYHHKVSYDAARVKHAVL